MTPLIAIPAILLAVTISLLVLFRYRYMHFCAMALKQTPWLKGADCEPLPDREDCEFHTSDGVTLRGSYLATPAAERLGVNGSWDFAFELMRRAHIAVTPGRDFGTAEPERFIRFSTANSMAQLQESVARLRNVLG